MNRTLRVPVNVALGVVIGWWVSSNFGPAFQWGPLVILAMAVVCYGVVLAVIAAGVPSSDGVAPVLIGATLCGFGLHRWVYHNVFGFDLSYDKSRRCARCRKLQIRVHDVNMLSGYRWLYVDDRDTKYEWLV